MGHRRPLPLPLRGKGAPALAARHPRAQLAQHKEELTRRRGQVPGCLEGAAASEDAIAALDASVAAAAAGCVAAVAARRDALLDEARARAAEAAAALRARNEAAFEVHVRDIRAAFDARLADAERAHRAQAEARARPGALATPQRPSQHLL